MTTFRKENINCAICNFGISEDVWSSTNTIGADLDTRPRGMGRQVYVTSIMVCPNYCSTDLSQVRKGVSEAMETQEYQRLNNACVTPDNDDYVRRWARDSVIHEHLGELSQAGWSALNAAWTCDDKSKGRTAGEYRNRALDLFNRCKKGKQSFAEDDLAEDVICVDIYRRIGDFAHGHELAKAALEGLDQAKSKNYELMKAILELQCHLCELGDECLYSIDDAESYLKNPSKWRQRRWWQFWQ